MNSREHVYAISVRFNEEILKEGKVLSIQKKRGDEKERKISTLLESKNMKPGQEGKNEKLTVVEYKQKIPYPAALVHGRNKDGMRKFMDIFKQLKINLLLCNLLLQDQMLERDAYKEEDDG